MRELPTGTVTFLFTDVEGSTRLLHELGPERYAERLAEHRLVLREAYVAHDGVEVDTQGDAFFVAFPTATGALAAAAGAQERLSLPVRMGLHTGTPLLTEEGYVGADVHRAARIAAAGHGGQVLVSAAAAALLPVDGLRDLGEHRLKDLSAPERIFQLGEAEFSPLKTLYRTNLPVPATPFLGREAELAQVTELLGRDDVRLLTLTGPGGSGKTRLALQAAGSASEAYPDGVWWVPLAAVADAAEVPATAARALGGRGPLAQLVSDRRLLLLLDNFEHVIDAATEVAALLDRCPRADVLVTSRERLRVHGEQAYPVPVLGRAEARELFVARARAVTPEFEPDEHVDELCARLDDLPLALELAAARTSLLSTHQLLERLASRLDLLRGGRDAELRQRTLRATIEWSYGLLTPAERRLLADLSVFRGGWTLDAAERVCEADLELLQSLTDKSLVRRWESGRFGMLETIREFAAGQLDAAEREGLLRRLAEHLLDVLADASLRPEEMGRPDIELAQAERPNVDVALAWAVASGEVELGLNLMWSLEMYWVTNDPLGGRERLDALLAAAGDDLDLAARARALRLRGGTFDFTGRFDLSELEYDRAIELMQAVGNEEQVAHLNQRIANSALQGGDVERAAALARESLEGERSRGNVAGQALSLNVLAMVAFAQGEVELGVALGHEAAACAEAVGFVWWRGVTLLQIAEQLVKAGQHEGAHGDFHAGLEALADVGDRINLAYGLGLAAVLAAAQGDVERAATLWGALEALAEREPRPTTGQAIAEYRHYLDAVEGAELEHARARGRALSLEEAVSYALANLD